METSPSQVLDLINFGGIVRALAIIAVTWVAAKLLTELTQRASESFTDRRLFIEQTSALLRFALYVVGTLLALRTMFALSKEVLTVMGGTIVVTVGLVLKDQASSILSGIMILIEKPFQVGDRVSFAGFYGTIKSIGLRSVRLTTLDDSEVTIPNSKFLSDAVVSGNSGALTMLVQQDFFIGADQDFDRAKTIIAEAMTSSRFFLADLPWRVNVNQVQMGNIIAIRLRAKSYVTELQYEKAFESDVSQKILRAFKSEHILPPALHVRHLDSRRDQAVN